jgi:hypothetical protein
MANMPTEFVPVIEDALSALSISRVLLILSFLKIAQGLESKACVQGWLGRALHDQIEDLDGQDATDVLKVYSDAIKLATLLEARHSYATTYSLIAELQHSIKAREPITLEEKP